MPWLDRLATGATGFGAATLGLARGPVLTTLIFHRVLPTPDPLFPREMDRARFDAAMQAVAQAFRVISLADAVQGLRQGSLPSRAMVITFDDGYADNEEIALPILQRHGLTATFFVATGFLGGGRMWNDTVIECLRRSPLDSVDLGAWGLGRLPLTSAEQRRQAIDRLLPKIKYLDLAAREQALANLRAVAGQPTLRDDLMMTRNQVQRLHAAGMGIGAHTVLHPILTSLPAAEAERELAQGKAALEAMIGAPVRHLAYPNGGPDRDYDSRHVAMARALGFEAAVTTATGVARPGDDLFQLPRFTPWDVSLPRWLLRLLSTQAKRGYRVAGTRLAGT